MKKTVGFVGLGMMGKPMAERLLTGGVELRVNNRTQKKAEDLVACGAVWCNSPRKTAEGSVQVHSMVADPAALREIALGSDGILAGLPSGGTHIDHSTVSPEVTRELAGTYRSAGRSFLHAPVLGSVPQAAEGSLLLFVGGDEEPYQRCAVELDRLGKRTWRFDRAEQATATKLLCNSFIAGMIVVLSQAIVLARKSSVDPAVLLEIIGQSQLNAPMFQAKGKAILERNFAPRFFVEHLLKDMNLVLDAAREAGASMPAVETARMLYEEAMAAGLAKEDYAAVVRILERRAGLDAREP